VSGPNVPCKQNVLLLPLNAGKVSRMDPSTASKPQVFCKIYNPSCHLWWSSQLVAPIAAHPVQSPSLPAASWSSRSLVHVDPARPRPPLNSTQIFLIAIELSTISTSFSSALQNFSSPIFHTQPHPTPTSPRRCLTRFWTQSWSSRKRYSCSRSAESRFARRHAQGATVGARLVRPALSSHMVRTHPPSLRLPAPISFRPSL
jgi:hypothetical protein